MNTFKASVSLIFLSVAFGAPLDGVKSAFVKDSEIWIAGADGSLAHRITTDGRPKSLPVWSPDGSRIAFVRGADDTLGELVVIDLSGSVSMERTFRKSETNPAGMRAIESLAWMSEEKLIVAGSIDPSTVEYAVINAKDGSESGGYLADGFSLKASRDGKHVAYQGFIPHFTREDDRKPQFCLDHECNFDETWRSFPGTGGARLDFVSDFQWSPDGSKVSAVAKNGNRPGAVVIVRAVDGKTSTYPLPEGVRETASVAWAGSADLVASSHGGSWSIDLTAGVSGPTTQQQPHVLQDADRLRREFRTKLGNEGDLQADLWCNACPLAMLPRRNGPLEAGQ